MRIFTVGRKMIYMMLVPRKNSYDLLDDIFDEDFFNIKPAKNEIMKTDIKEHDNRYEMITDLQGYDKRNIKISIDNGYLTIYAKTNNEKEDKEKNGKVVRKERYYGECQRSFYVGDDIKEEDIKATFDNGTLTINIPKKEKFSQENKKKYIEIE
jgi:HSP20 family molecular chaperone IbpA